MVDVYSLSDEIQNKVLADTVLSYASIKIPTKQFNDLKNGTIPWDSKLDLQGLPTHAAREALCEFISKQVKDNKKCVLILHGSESRRGVAPILKNLVNRWLPQIDDVLAFHSAKTRDGGLDAIYVILKQKAKAGIPPRVPKGNHEGSMLVAESKAMERKRRLAEQQGHRQLASVKAREHADETPHSAPEGELQNNILQHPDLDNQRFDGIDPNLNPEPPLNTDARREFDNEKREQDKEKQLRLGNMPKFTTAPTPRGP